MKIGIFYYSSIYEQTGSGAVVRTFSESNSIFKDNGIDSVQLFSLTPDQKCKVANVNKETATNKFKNIIRNILNVSYLGNCLCIKLQWFRHGKQVVSQYFQSSKFDEDVLIFHEVFSCHYYLEECKKRSIEHKKYILILHTNGEVWKMLKIYYPKIVDSNFESWLEKVGNDCLSGASKIVFVSNISKKNFDSLYPQYSEKSTVVYNGIAQSNKTIQTSFNSLNLVTVGTVNQRKNQIMLLECLKKINNSSIHITIIGGGDMLEACKQKCFELNLNEQVDFLGPRTDVEDLLLNCNVFIMSSLDEGLPIAGIEALRAGLPVILTDVGGNSELIEDNGVLVRPQVDSIVDAISYLNEHREKLAKMSQKSLKLFEEKFSSKCMIGMYCKIIREITR